MAKKDPAKKPLCFVVGPIGKEGSDVRKHADMMLHAIIRNVLATEEFGYEVRRADDDGRPGMITDRVITDIIAAELVIADLTGLNPNVFYELGIRHAADKPAIHITAQGTDLPFDNFGHHAIFVDLGDWNSSEKAREQLAAAARSIKSNEYSVSNPITQAKATFRMRASEDPKDRVIAGLQDRISALEDKNRISSLENKMRASHAIAPGSIVSTSMLDPRVFKLPETITASQLPAEKLTATVSGLGNRTAKTESEGD